VLIHGEVAAVTSSVKAGVKVGGSHVIEKTVIPRIHPQVIEAINLATPMYERNALGILEFFSVTSAIMGADAAVKAAEINLIEVRLGTGIGGKSFVTFTGEVAAVSESCKAGAAAGGSNGMLVDSVVIPSPREEIFRAVM
jgi:microcompartment protein CcmL/EutN